MKMTAEHYAQLNNLMIAVIDETGWTLSHWKNAYNRPKISMKRLRWDFFHAIEPSDLIPMLDKLYKYLDDSHIDTALRKITGTK